MVSFTEILRELSMKQDVQESLWCLWCLLDHFYHEFSRTSRFMLKSREISVKDTTDTTNSLAHLTSCSNLLRFHKKTPQKQCLTAPNLLKTILIYAKILLKKFSHIQILSEKKL